jgi:hypothetical protein
MVGMREAQLEKTTPEKKKKAPRNALCLSFNSIKARRCNVQGKKPVSGYKNQRAPNTNFYQW